MAAENHCENNNLSELYENLIVIDCGANLTNKKFFKDLDQVIHRAQDSGVRKILVHGSNIKNCKEALRLTRIYPGIIYSSAGIHPMDSKNVIDEPSCWHEFEEISKQSEVVAIGPCGLDYHKDVSECDIQKEIFRRQIKLACDIQKPLLIHERSAQNDVMEILSSFPESELPPRIVRSFMGTTEEALMYLRAGFYLSLTGFLCKDKSENSVRKLLEDNLIPLDHLLVESDAPFMYPNTRASKLSTEVKACLTERSLMYLHRYCTFQRNEPCCLPALVELIAAFMQKKPEDIALSTAFNALKLFGLSQ